MNLRALGKYVLVKPRKAHKTIILQEGNIRTATVLSSALSGINEGDTVWYTGKTPTEIEGQRVVENKQILGSVPFNA